MKMFIAGLALVAASVVSANAQAPTAGANMTGTDQFCLAGSGNANCIYQTMVACETAKKVVNSTAECVARTQLNTGTVGSGAPATPPANPPASNTPR